MRSALALLLTMALLVGAAPAGAVTTSRNTTLIPAPAMVPQATPGPSSRARATPAPAAAPAATTPTEGGTTPFAPSVDPAATEEGMGTPNGKGDWLMHNGLRSPMCPEDSALASCTASGTLSSPAPPGYYAFDVHVDKNVTSGKNTFAGLWLDLLGLLWSGVVMLTAAMFAALEWALSLDLVATGNSQLAPKLRSIWTGWALPLSAIGLGVGAIYFAHLAIYKRNLGAALGRAGGGIAAWLVVMTIVTNPAGTVGLLTKPSSELGRGAISISLMDPAATTGSNQQAALTKGLSSMWTAVITKPWALLEFGDVNWATNPKKLDPELKRAAMAIANEQGPKRQQRVRAARTNGDLFLVWGANQNERNSISDDKCNGKPCLLRVLCGSDDDNDCKGENASIAEFRTETGTGSRTAMLALVVLGLIPVLLVIGVCVVGLLGSAALLIFFLLKTVFVAPLALVGKGSAQAKLTQTLMKVVAMAIAAVIYGVAVGLTMATFSMLQALDVGGYIMQLLLTTIAMFFLWKNRDELGGQIKGIVNPHTVAKKTQRRTERTLRRVSQRTTKRAAGGGAGKTKARPGSGVADGFPDAPPARRQGSAPKRDHLGRDLKERAGAAPIVGPAFAAAAAKGTGAASLVKGAAQVAPTGPGAKAAMLAGTTVAGPVGAVVVAAAVTGWRARARANRNRIAGINRGDLPEVIRPAEQGHALLAGVAAAAARSAKRLPDLEARQERIRAERAHVLTDLAATDPSDPRREELVRRRDELGGQLADVDVQASRARSAQKLSSSTAASRNSDGTFNATSRRKADDFLDRQAQAEAPERDYGRLAQMQHLSREEYEALPEPERRDLQRNLDRQLQQRAAHPAPSSSPPASAPPADPARTEAPAPASVPEPAARATATAERPAPPLSNQASMRRLANQAARAAARRRAPNH